MSYIDPIAVKDQQAKFGLHLNAMSTGARASEALVWFHTYASDRKSDEVINLSAKAVASCTRGVEQAQSYFDAAAKRYHDDIVKMAIEMADNDFQKAKALMK